MAAITLRRAGAAEVELDSDLTDIAALGPAEDDILQYKDGAWANRDLSQVKTDLGITAELVDIGGIAPADDDLLQRKAGVWTNRTPAQVLSDMAITSGVSFASVDKLGVD